MTEIIRTRRRHHQTFPPSPDPCTAQGSNHLQQEAEHLPRVCFRYPLRGWPTHARAHPAGVPRCSILKWLDRDTGLWLGDTVPANRALEFLVNTLTPRRGHQEDLLLRKVTARLTPEQGRATTGDLREDRPAVDRASDKAKRPCTSQKVDSTDHNGIIDCEPAHESCVGPEGEDG